MFEKNQYNNSNDSSHENKSFYEIVKDSPLIQNKDSNMNNSSESQKEFFKALREENRQLVNMDGMEWHRT